MGSWAQHEEALHIRREFGKKNGVAVDIGAADGLNGSNTKHLELAGWRVLCIEPNPIYAAILRHHRNEVMELACGKQNRDGQKFKIYETTPGNFQACSSLKPDPTVVQAHGGPKPSTTQVNVRTLDWCLEKAGITKLDLVSIDVEGTEQDVLDGFDIGRWKPKMVIIEDWRGGQYRNWFCNRGYYVKARCGVNEIFLRANPERPNVAT